MHSSQSAPSTILLESTSKPQLAAAFHGSNSSQKPTRGGPAKKVISHKLDPDLLFRDRTGERHTQLPALSGSRHVRRSNSTSEIETSASLASLSPHRVLPDIAIGADVASGAFQEAQDERSSAQHNLAASETAEPSQHQAARPHTADAAGQRALQEERRAGRETEQPGSDETSKAHDLSTEAKAAQGQEQEKEQVKEEPGCPDPREMQRYLEQEGVRATVQRLVEKLVLYQPDDPVQYMIDTLEREVEVDVL